MENVQPSMAAPENAGSVAAAVSSQPLDASTSAPPSTSPAELAVPLASDAADLTSAAPPVSPAESSVPAVPQVTEPDTVSAATNAEPESVAQLAEPVADVAGQLSTAVNQTESQPVQTLSEKPPQESQSVELETDGAKPQITAPPLQNTETNALETNHDDEIMSVSAPKGRLPHDIIGILEDRVKEDPRGDIEGWLALIEEHKKRGKMDAARSVYERCLAVFPFAILIQYSPGFHWTLSCHCHDIVLRQASIWLAYAQMENEAEDRHAVDNVLGKSLMQVPDLSLWNFYLDHVQRHNNLTTDTSGAARQTITSAYDLALKQVGLDKDSGPMWLAYLAFIKSGPGMVGGSSWQDQQKMDSLRKAYQRAVCVPTQATNVLWKEYDAFEMGLNKLTDHSPAYMSARSSYTELQNLTNKLHRTALPALPPMMGCEGDVEYAEQLAIWRQWIAWEQKDPLVLAKDDPEMFKNRVLFVYRHALMAMRFWPELWYEASEFCFANDLEETGHDCLVDGMVANPESCLLAFRRADRLEQVAADEENDDKSSLRASSIKEPLDQLLTALYQLILKVKANEERDIAQVERQFAATEKADQEHDELEKFRVTQRNAQIEALKAASSVQTRLLSQTLSYAWIALMRALRRVQGKGGVDQGGARGTFQEARRRGRITSDVYVEAALIEYHCYDPDTGTKIFERGLKLFQEDERFALEYIRHLVATNDHTNARVVFETAATRLAQKPETLGKTKPLYAFFHDFESRYGELSQIIKLEKRMQDLFPEDPTLSSFSRRFVQAGFDPTAIRLIVSPAKQTRPKTLAAVAEEAATVAVNGADPSQAVSPPLPKRPLEPDETEEDLGDRPRKVVRGESPVRAPVVPVPVSQVARPAPPPSNHIKLPPPLPRDVNLLLSIIPKAESYQATKFDAEKMVKLVRETNVPTSLSQAQAPPVAVPGRMPPSSGFPPVAMANGPMGHYPQQPPQQFPQPMGSSGFPMSYGNGMPGFGMTPQPYGGMPMGMAGRPGMPMTGMPGPMSPSVPMGFYGGQPSEYQGLLC